MGQTTTESNQILNIFLFMYKQVSDPQPSTADSIAVTTDTVSSGAQQFLKPSDQNEEANMSTDKPGDSVESMDETLEEYLAGDNSKAADNTAVDKGAISAMDTSYGTENDDGETHGEIPEGDDDKSENEATMSQSEDELDDDLPAGLIRGEPVLIPPENYQSASAQGDDDGDNESEPVEQETDDEECPRVEETAVSNTMSPRQRKSAIAMNAEASDSESVTMEAGDEDQFEIDIKDKLTSTKTYAAKVRSRKGHEDNSEAPEESGKKDFMKKNFNLFTPRELEEQRSKRRSARISNAEQLQQVGEEFKFAIYRIRLFSYFKMP